MIFWFQELLSMYFYSFIIYILPANVKQKIRKPKYFLEKMIDFL